VSQGRDRQTAALRQAAAAKAARARQAAEKALRQVIKSGEPVTFASVARAAQVSPHYLRSQPDLAERISRLRAAQTSSGPGPAPDPRQEHGEPSVIAVLRARLRTEKDQHRAEVAQLREERRELERKLAAAHAEVLRLRSTYETNPEHLHR